MRSRARNHPHGINTATILIEQEQRPEWVKIPPVSIGVLAAAKPQLLTNFSTSANGEFVP
jgi:hypothetical protein